MVSGGSIVDQASIGGFELAAGSKPRQHAIVIQGTLASSGESYIFVDGNGTVTSGSANGQTAACSFGAGSVTLGAAFVANDWIIGKNEATGTDGLDIFMAHGDIAIQPKQSATGSNYQDPVAQTVTAAAARSTTHADYTVANHGYAVGDIVQITGSAVANWNVDPTSGGDMTGEITTVADANTFSIADNASGFTAFSGTATVRMFTTAGEVSVTSINGGTVNFEIGQSDLATALLTMAGLDSYRLTLTAYARGGI